MKNSQNIEKLIYTGKTRTTGGRIGNAKSSDGQLEIILSTPGSKEKGTNPEQLLAAGWSACYIGALGLAAKGAGITLPNDIYVDAEIDLVTIATAFQLQARLKVDLPGIAPEIAEHLFETAHQICPYSKALHGNIPITTILI